MPMKQQNLQTEGNGEIEDMLAREKEGLPNLQLSLSHNLGDVGGDTKHRGKGSGTGSAISLSLSLPPSKLQGHPSEKQKDNNRPEILFLQIDSSKKATMRLSTLDLTMSI